MPWSSFAISLILCVIGEVLAGNWGLLVPLVPIGAFYFTMRFGAARVLSGALLAAAVTDAMWMHHFPSQVVTVASVVGLSSLWRGFGDLGGWLSLSLSGVVVGLVAWLGQILSMLTFAGHAMTWHSALRPLPLLLLEGVVLTPTVSLVINQALKKRIAWGEEFDEEEE